MAITVSYEELQSPTYVFDRQKQEAKRYFYVPNWDDVTTFFLQMWPSMVGGAPSENEYMPGLPWLVLDHMDIEPFVPEKVDTGTPPKSSSGSKIVATYRSKGFFERAGTGSHQSNSDLPGRGSGSGPGGGSGAPAKNISYKVSLGGHFVTASNFGLKWASDGATVAKSDISAGIVEVTIDHHVTWHDVANPPWRAIRRCAGRINSAAYMGAPTGCLLFLGLEGSREINVSGQRKWELAYKFSEKNNGSAASPKGWDYFFRPDVNPAGWERIDIVGGAAGIYPEEDFTNLFVSDGA